jgi:hypothetical protein
MTTMGARFQGEYLIKRPSLRSQLIEWVLWRLRDSGPMWVANPLSCDFYVHYTSPV